ncbi:molybdenum cofactor biosynthesis protein MoaE [Methylomonas sp. MED-D]|uniref:molybdenum cofactor biosynthesis protein MoaE n=1 Tax=unclassified Methylomonas TaxID=2608980 RepID=UPI0028A4AFD2|nr:molybdenum cofactor biosynthesis protein MoaE [Methylomonas sp. MV1]MDT4330644.1 molybdenum cofactor biosynthesis protein MoaE [Methylomonas sp. MV1]
MTIRIVEQTFEPWSLLADYERFELAENIGKYGAAAVFVGSMRDFNLGDGVIGMTLHHYPGMTEKQLATIVVDANSRWALLDTLVIHRVGEVQPGDTLVLVAAWAEHRGDAFDASRYIMEALKSRAPFWKRETLAAGQSRWVEKNSDGYKV